MSTRIESGFDRRTMLAVVLFGFFAFLAMLYFIGAGDTGDRSNNGSAHAASKGLNGYAGLVELLKKDGFEASLSRSPSGFDTPNLLVITPPTFFEPEDLNQILDDREYVGPTLVILPKWQVSLFPDDLPEEIEDEVKKGWVRIIGANAPDWPEELAETYRFTPAVSRQPADQTWQGLGASGELPDALVATSGPNENYRTLVSYADGLGLALSLLAGENIEASNEDDDLENWPRERVIFVVEPDLLNNYGMSDAARADLALALFEDATDGRIFDITFDLTLNGLGATTNLLTLAFRPPFLAATLCLLFAMLIIGWRAFKRFGPPTASGQAIAFGKNRLVSNGADLIVRGRRLNLLAAPFAAISRRRLAQALGIKRDDADSLDAALDKRLGVARLFSTREAELARASNSKEIIRAATALKELEGLVSK